MLFHEKITMKRSFVLPLFLLIATALCCKKNVRDGFSQCEENCHYLRMDCMVDCRQNAIEFSFDLKPGGEDRNRVFSCGERCEDYYGRCIANCKSMNKIPEIKKN